MDVIRASCASQSVKKGPCYIENMNHAILQSLSDDELLHQLTELVSRARRVEADLVAHMGEVDERRLYAREACSSMFAYATEVLHLSEAEAYLRIAVARAARKFPHCFSGSGMVGFT